MILLGLVLMVAASVVAAVDAGPASSQTSRELLKCAGYCEGRGTLGYEVGASYLYDYRAPMSTSVTGVRDDSDADSRLQLTATVEIHVASPCDLILQLSDVSLSDRVGNTSTPDAVASDFSSTLSRHPLAFSFHDGVVGELCASPHDPAWALNVKRGVVSMFQNSVRNLDAENRVHETDVIGECETEYNVVEVDRDSNMMIFEKSKSTLSCARPSDSFLSLQATAYSAPAQSTPIVTTNTTCFVRYELGTLVMSVCSEVHQLRPFSAGDSGVVTQLQQYLYVKQVVYAQSPPAVGETVRTTLQYQHHVTAAEASSRATGIVATLDELKRLTDDGVDVDAPRIFSALVATLRTTTYPTLAKVFSATRERHARKFLLTAMPLIGTADSLTVMTDLYRSGEISQDEMDAWLTSLTFLKRPSLTMLLAVSSLLDAEPRPNAVLGISSMIHGYCERDAECRSKEAVVDAVAKIERLLGDGCHVKGRSDMELKITALKGLGNAGVLPASIDNIKKCYQKADNPLEVRLAAVSAHRRMPCASTWRHGLRDVFTDRAQDTELRITAYLTLMQCPSARTIISVKQALEQEDVNQVGSFVWTHLNNLQHTSTRWKQEVRDLLATDLLRDKFQTDGRKFSRNYEASTFSEALNAGASAEANVVFTPASYLPRAASLNLTVDVFGQSVNLLEVGARAEGLEKIVEDMFGPGGYFPDKTMRQVLIKARGGIEDDLENSVDALAASFNANRKLQKEPQASVYARVFGNEIHHSRYQGLAELLGAHPNMKNPVELFTKLFGGNEVDFTDSFLLLDSTYRIPTIVGFPLELSVNATATVSLKVTGHVDLRDLWRKSTLEVRGRVAPSAAVRVEAMMAVDAHVARTGLHSISALHTNTYLDGSVVIQGGSVVDVKMNVPREKVEVLEISTRMFVLQQDRVVEVIGDPKWKEEFSECSSQTMSKLTGMQLCTDLVYYNATSSETAPYFPLTGPAELRVTLLKTDSFDSYELNFNKQSLTDSLTYKFHMDTPGSTINRKIDAFLSLDASEGAVKGTLVTPAVKIDLSGKVDVGEESRSLALDLRVDDEDVVRTRLGLVTVRGDRMNRYEPTLSLYVRHVTDVEMKGRVNFVEGSKYNAALKLSGLTQEPILFSADVAADDGRYELIGSLDSPVLACSVHGNLRHTSTQLSSKLTVEYSVNQQRTHTVSLAARVLSLAKGDISKHSVHASIQTSQAPRYNAAVGWELTRSSDSVESKTRLALGQVEWLARQLYRLRRTDDGDVDFAVACSFSCAAKSVDYKLDLLYKTTPESWKSSMLAQLNPKHRYVARADYTTSVTQLDISAELACPWHSAVVIGALAESTPGEYAMRLAATHSPAGRPANAIALAGTYTRQEGRHEVRAELTGAWRAEVIAGVEFELDRCMMWTTVDVRGSVYKAVVKYVRNLQGIHKISAEVQLVDRSYRAQVQLLDAEDEKSVFIDLQLSKRLTVYSQVQGLDGKLMDVKFELYWDKDQDPSRRISLAASLNQHRRAVLLEFPGQYVKGEVNISPTSASSLLEWAEDKKIRALVSWQPSEDGFHASALLSTPFPGLEEQSVAAGYRSDKHDLKVTTRVSWLNESLDVSLHGSSMEATYSGEVQLTSTLAPLASLHASFKHERRSDSTNHVHTVTYNHRPLLATAWYADQSGLAAEFALATPAIKAVIKRGGGNYTLNASYEASVLVIRSLLEDPGRILFVNVVTPFRGFENSTARITYGDLKFTADFEHNKTSSSLYMSEARSSNFILGSAILTTSFTAPLEVGFTHSTDDSLLKEGLSISSSGEQLFLASLVGSKQIDDLKLTADLTMPTHSVTATVENRLADTGLVSRLDAVWNGDRISTSIVAVFPENEFQAVASLAGTGLSREMKLSVAHKRNPGSSYESSVDLTGVGGISHKLELEDRLNWLNKIEVKTSKRIAYIFNKQKTSEKTFFHRMDVEMNGPQVSAEVSFTTEEVHVTRANGKLETPWTHPITLTFQLAKNETAYQPKLRFHYSSNKEISVESVFEYDLLKSRLALDINSPFCKPITINALYDVSIPTKVVLLTLRWEDKQMDFKSTVHWEHLKAVGVVVATRSDVEGHLINAQFKYDVSNLEDMAGHLTLMLKEKKMQIDLSGILAAEKTRMNFEITTPFTRWEKLSAMFDVDLRKPTMTGVALISRNEERLELSGSALLSRRNGEVSISLVSSLPCVSGWRLHGRADESRLEATCDYAGVKSAVVLTHGDVTELTIRTPVKGFELVSGRMSYERDMSWNLELQKNQEKVEVIVSWKRMKDNGVASVIFKSPFVGLEQLEALLEHEISPDTMRTNIVLRKNMEAVQIISTFVSNDAWSSKIEIVTPIDGYENLEAELKLSSNSGINLAALNLVQNGQRWLSIAELRMQSLLHFDFKVNIEVPFWDFKNIQSGLLFHWMSDERNLDVYVQLPEMRNEIKLKSIYTPASRVASIKASAELPFLISDIFIIEGEYDIAKPSLRLQGNIGKETALLQFELLSNSFSASLLTSVKGLEKINLETNFQTLADDSTVLKGLLLVGNVTETVVSFESTLGPSQSNVLIKAKTPIKRWEDLMLTMESSLLTPKKELKASFKSGLQDYSASVEWQLTERIAEGLITVHTPVRHYELMSLGGKYQRVKDNLDASLVMVKNTNQLRGEVNVTRRSVQFKLDTPWEGFKTMQIFGSFGGIRKTNTLTAKMVRNKVTSQLEVGLNTDKDTTTLTINTPLAVCRTFVAVFRQQRPITTLSIAKNSLSIFEFASKVVWDSPSKIGLNVNISSAFLPVAYKKVLFSSQYNVEKLKKSFELSLRRNEVNSLDFSSSIAHTVTGGFTFLMQAQGEVSCFNKREFMLDYHPEGTVIKTSFVVSNSTKMDKYMAQFGLSSTSVQFSLNSPVKGYEQLVLILSRNDKTAVASFATTMFFYDFIKLAYDFNLETYEDNFITFSMKKGENYVNADWRLELDSTLFARTSLTLATSSEEYRSASLSLEYDLEGNNKGAIFAIEKNQRSFKVESIVLRHGPASVEASLNITSSSSEDIKFYGCYDFGSTSTRKMSVMGLWGEDQQVDIRFVQESISPEASIISLLSVTPYRATTFSFEGSYDFSNPANTQTATLSFNGFDVSASFRAAVQDFWKQGKLSGSVGNEDEAKALGFGVVSWKLVNEREKKEAQLILDFGEGRKTEADFTVGINGLNNVKIRFNFIDFSERSYEFTADWSSSQYKVNSQFGYKWNTEKQIILKSEFNYENYYPSSVNIIFTSPFQGFKNIDFLNKWHFEDSTTRFSLLLKRDNYDNIAFSFMFSDDKLQLTFVAPKVKTFDMEINRSASRSDIGAYLYSLDSSISLGSWKSQFTFSQSLHSGGNNSLEASLKTPITGITSLHLHSKWNLVTKEAMLLIEKEIQKWGITSALIRSDGKSRFNVIVSTPFKSYEELRLESSCSVSDGITSEVKIFCNTQKAVVAEFKLKPAVMSLEIESPLKWFDTVSAVYAVKPQGPLYGIIVDASAGQKYVKLQASVDTNTEKTILVEMSFTSSYTDDIVLSGVYEREPNHTVRIVLRKGQDKQTDISGTFHRVSENMRQEIHLESTVNGEQSFVVKAGYNWQKPLKKMHLQVVTGETTIVNARAEGKGSREGIAADVHLDTPFDAVKLVELKVHVEKTGYLSEIGSYALKFNDKDYVTRYVFEFAPNAIRGQFSVQSPSFQVEEATVDVKHGKNFIIVSVGVDGKTCDFQGSFQVDEPKSYLKAKLSAPFVKSLELIEVTFDLDLADAVFSSKTQWTPTDEVKLDVQFGVSDFTLGLNTPFPELRAMQISTKMELEADAYKLLGRASWNNLRMDVDGSMTLGPFDTDVNFEAADGEVEIFSGRVALSTSREKVSGLVNINTMNKTVNIAGEVDTSDLTNLITKLIADIPFFGMEPINAFATLKLQSYKELLVQVDIPNVSYKFGASYIFQDKNLKIGLDFDLPVFKSNIAMGGSVKNNQNKDVEANVFVNENRITFSYTLVDKVLTSSLDLDFPFFKVLTTRVDFQASTDYHPDLHASVTVKSGQFTGTVTASFTKSAAAFTTRVDANIPLLLGPLEHKARLSASYGGTQKFVEVRYDNGKNTRSASVELDMKADWHLIGRATGPRIGEKEVSFLLQKNWERLWINLLDKLTIEVKQDSNSGSLTVEYGGKEHKLDYLIALGVNLLKGNINIESPAMRYKTMSIQVEFVNHGDDIAAGVSVTTGTNTNTATIAASTKNDTKTLVVDVTRDTSRLFLLEVASVVSDNLTQGGIAVELLGSQHAAAINVTHTWPGHLHVALRSPLLPDGSFEIEVSIADDAILARAALGEMKNNKYVTMLANMNMIDGNAGFEFEAPSFPLISRVMLAADYQAKDVVTALTFAAVIVSSKSESQFRLNFGRSSSSIESTLVITTPFEDLPGMLATVNIPLVVSDNMDFVLAFNLPKDLKFGLEAVFLNQDEQMKMKLATHYRDTEVSAGVHIQYDPVPTLELSLKTPLPMINYRVQLKRQGSFQDGGDYVNFIEWNDQRIELRHVAVNTPTKVIFRVQLTTPWSRYLAGVHFQFDEHKKALITVGFPGLQEDWIVDFDIRLNNPRDLSFLTQVRAPIFPGFEAASFMIGSKYEGNKYRGVVTARYNNDEVMMLTEGSVDVGDVKGEAKFQFNSQKLHFNLFYTEQEPQSFTAGLELETPFEIIKNSHVHFLFSLPSNKIMETSVMYNSVEIMDLSFVKDSHGYRTLTLRNPWKPASLKYLFSVHRDIQVWTELRYDLNKQTSKLGGGFALKTTLPDRSVSIVVRLPTRDVSFNASLENTDTLFESSAHLSLDFNQTLGYRIVFGRERVINALARVDFPFRSFETSAMLDVTSGTGMGGVTFLWDAASDRAKQVGISTMLYSDGMAQVTFKHSALKHDITLTAFYDNVVPFTPHKPRLIKLILDYSNLPEDTVVFKYISNDDPNNRQIKIGFKHISSKLDHSADISLVQTLQSTSSKATLTYLNVNRQPRLLEVFGQAFHSHPELRVFVRTTENMLGVNASSWTREVGRRGVNVALAMNHKHPLSVDVGFSAEDADASLEVKYGDARRYTVRASAPSASHVTAAARHWLYGSETVDGEITLRLNTSRLLWTRLAWKLGAFDSLKQSVLSEYSSVTNVARSVVDAFAELADEDVFGRLEAVADAVGGVMSDVGVMSLHELELIGRDFESIGTLARQMYERNDFYLKDIHMAVKEAVLYAREKASCLVKQALEVTGAVYTSVKSFAVAMVEALSVDFTPLRIFCSELRPLTFAAWNHTMSAVRQLHRSSQVVRDSLRTLLVATREALARTDAAVAELRNAVDVCAARVAQRVATVAQLYANSAQHFTILVHDSLVAVERSLAELQEAVYSTVMSVKEVREVVELSQRYIGWLQHYSALKCLDAVVSYLNTLGDVLIEDFKRMIEDYREQIDTVASFLNKHLEKVDQVPAVVHAKQLANTVYQKAVWTWRYLSVTHEAWRLLDTLTTDMLAALTSSGRPQLRSEMLVRPGLVVISQPLPFVWHSFDRLPQYAPLEMEDFPGTASLATVNMLDAVLDVNTSVLSSGMLPPYGATGLVMDGTHFITFDNRYYRFRGGCSYLLAGDLVDGRFSVVLNYHETGTSLSILSEGHLIHVSASHRVTVDGVRTELPASIGAATITRAGDRLSVVTDHLAEVECSLRRRACAVHLSGWHFGRTAGLLGSYDNEPADDMRMPSGEVTTDVERFAASWRVSPSKRCIDVANITSPTQLSAEHCDATFAPLATCAAVVDPRGYVQMCRAGEECGAVIAYALQCAAAGVTVAVPRQCVTCRAPDGHDILPGTSNSPPPTSSTDVVFLVEASDCVTRSGLGRLPERLEAALVQRGLTDNRYSLVTFGAEPPHSRTVKGELWSSARAVDKALQDQNVDDDSMPTPDNAALDAITFATRLSYRVGASKTLVLVTCGACRNTAARELRTTLAALAGRGFTLHVLRTAAVSMRAHGSAKVYGADLAGAYTARNVKSIAPSRSLLKEVVLPRDGCSPLAFETNGTVFNLERAADGRKKFADVWSRRVAQTASPAPCQTCACEVDSDAGGVLRCADCVQPDVDQLVKNWQNLLMEDYGQIEIQNAKYSDEQF